MSKIKVKITAVDQKNKEDVKMAKIFKKMINEEFDDYIDSGLITAISQARHYFLLATGQEAPPMIWENVIKAVIQLRINDYKKLRI